MTLKNKKYLSTWIAISILIVAATASLLRPYLNITNDLIKISIDLVSWVMIISAAIYLFIIASNASIQKNLSQTKPDKEHFPERKKTSRTESKHLDIQTVARKINRKVRPNDDQNKWSKQLLTALVSEIEIMSGVVYFRNSKGLFEVKASYSIPHSGEPYTFKEGEGLSGQAAANHAVTIYSDIPADYTKVFSGLGSGNPKYIAMIPIILNEKCIALIEIAGFRWMPNELEQLFNLISKDLAESFNTQKSRDK